MDARPGWERQLAEIDSLKPPRADRLQHVDKLSCDALVILADSTVAFILGIIFRTREYL